jgi:hypothetical protein
VLVGVGLGVLAALVGRSRNSKRSLIVPEALSDADVARSLVGVCEVASDGPMRVSVAVPDKASVMRIFGRNLADKGIQPVWVEIHDADTVPYWFFPASLDSNYFSVSEVSHALGAAPGSPLAEAVQASEIGQFVIPGSTIRGFVFTNAEWGTKQVTVNLVGENRARSVRFEIPTPGRAVDHASVDFAGLYSDAVRSDTTSEDELREALEAMPDTVTDQDGTGTGDPLDVVVVGEPNQVLAAFLRCGWDETEPSTKVAMWNAVKAYVLFRPYAHTLFSPLYVFGRRQDFSLQKARRTISKRNHLRLWMTPISYHGTPVWVGTVSRDTGVRLTTKTWPPITHAIDRDMDEARTFLLEDLMLSQTLRTVGFVGGAALSTADAPRVNLTGDTYTADGTRVVLMLADTPTPPENVTLLDWERPARFAHDFDTWMVPKH